jgi:hypothetical protein
MNRMDDPRPLNVNAILDTIYRGQTDLKLLVEHLARERNPDLADRVIVDLATLHMNLQDRLPSVRRH